LDLVVRYGGEEFVLVLAQVRLEQALMVAEKLRAKVEAYPWYELHPDLRITVSIGLCADTTLEHHERMLAVADDKMYVAKRNGKNQVQA
jgi:diguanylate cyclase (GGDEF)-like protein